MCLHSHITPEVSWGHDLCWTLSGFRTPPLRQSSPDQSVSREPHHSMSAENAYVRGSRSLHDTRAGRGCLLPSPSQSTSSHNTPPPWNPNGVWPGGPGSSHLEGKQSRNFSKICFCLLKTGIFSPLTLWLKVSSTCEFSFSQVSKQSVFPTALTLDSHCRCIHKRRPVHLLHMTTMKFPRPQMGKHFQR